MDWSLLLCQERNEVPKGTSASHFRIPWSEAHYGAIIQQRGQSRTCFCQLLTMVPDNKLANPIIIIIEIVMMITEVILLHILIILTWIMLVGFLRFNVFVLLIDIMNSIHWSV